jgi:hypothetical protein
MFLAEKGRNEVGKLVIPTSSLVIGGWMGIERAWLPLKAHESAVLVLCYAHFSHLQRTTFSKNTRSLN